VWEYGLSVSIRTGLEHSSNKKKKEKGTFPLFGTAVSIFSDRWARSVHTQ